MVAHGTWGGPDGALTVTHNWNKFDKAGQNYSLRTKRWRYINWKGEIEELYDYTKDPAGRHNLVDNPKYSDVLNKHRLLMADMTGLTIKGVVPKTLKDSKPQSVPASVARKNKTAAEF